MFRLSRWLCQRNVFVFIFALVEHVGTIMFAGATGTTISSSLGRQYRPVLSLSFSDIYGLVG
jgi:hypothetical protein